MQVFFIDLHATDMRVFFSIRVNIHRFLPDSVNKTPYLNNLVLTGHKIMLNT